MHLGGPGFGSWLWGWKINLDRAGTGCGRRFHGSLELMYSEFLVHKGWQSLSIWAAVRGLPLCRFLAGIGYLSAYAVFWEWRAPVISALPIC